MESPSRRTQDYYDEYMRDGIFAVKEGRLEMAARLLRSAIGINDKDARPYIWLAKTTDDKEQQIALLETALALEPFNVQARQDLVALKGEPAESEKVVDLFNIRAHRAAWLTHERPYQCVACGACILLPANQRSLQCPYCGSNQVMLASRELDQDPPESILLMRIDERQAGQAAYDWLNWGVFAPDQLQKAGHTLRLSPAYYSCWVLDGALELRRRDYTWKIEQGTGYLAPSVKNDVRMFRNVLVSGVSALSDDRLRDLAPFDLALAETLRPEHLAGWPAILYDVSLETARKRAIKQIVEEIKPGGNGTGLGDDMALGGNWSSMNYQHVLIPVWVGEYHFNGKPYRLFINGQTGKVTGAKPIDPSKVMVGLVAFLALAAAILGIIFLLSEF